MADDAAGSSRSSANQRKSKHSEHSQNTRSKLAKLFGLGQKNTAEEEILELVDDAEQDGSIDERTRSLISNVFDFADISAGDIMTHRTEMVAVEDTETLKTLTDLAIETGYSRIPVFHEDVDNIVGVIYIKDLLKFVCSDTPDEVKLTDIMRPVLFIPYTKSCSELFTEMTAKKIQIAVVVDEYGGTEGLVTMEDLLESIVGNIQDEYDNESEDVVWLDDDHYIVDGSADIEDLEELTGAEIDKGDCDTVAGLILDRLGHFPSDGENPVVETDGLRLRVVSAEDRRILQVSVEKIK